MPILWILVMLASQPAMAEHFEAPLTDSRWQVIETPLDCALIQHIPGFGEGGFFQASAQQLAWRFTSLTLPAAASEITFESMAAPWHNNPVRHELARRRVSAGQTRFSVEGVSARLGLNQLWDGRFVLLRYRPEGTSLEIEARLSTVNLAPSLDAFQQCVANLSPYSFDDMRATTVGFASEQSSLDPAARRQLQRLAEYIVMDERISRVHIAGHTDNRGRRRLNTALSEARVEAVRDYLLEQGVEPALITSSSHLEYKPLASNATTEGRAQNRRAEITLFH